MAQTTGTVCLLGLIITLLCLTTDIESAKLEIRPSTNVQAGSSALTIRCSAASGLGIIKLYTIQVKRTVYSNTGTGTDRRVGSIDSGETANLGSGFTQPKYTATGSLPSKPDVSGSYLQIVIKDPDCTDQAEYSCITVAGDTQGIITPTPEQNRNVTVQSNPGNLNMYAVPERSTYNVNQTITLTCKGDIGNPRKIWGWQIQRFPDSARWERYPDNNDIKDGIIIPPSGNKCSYSQETILTYVVKATDNGLQIRCILDNNEAYNANKTIYNTFKPIDNKPEGNTGEPANSDVGLIAGVTVAVIIIIVIIIVVVVVVIRRKKKQGGSEEYDTREGNKPTRDYDNEMKKPDNYPSQGVVNKSLDEPHEKSRRPYGNHDNGGGHHNAVMDDSVSNDMPQRNEYLDDDGTDMRGSNANLGSRV